MQVVTKLLMGTAVVLCVATIASAQNNEPKKANITFSKLVTAYAPCTVPNDTTTGPLPLPACAPAVRLDPGCGFGSKGQGKLKANVVGSSTPTPNTQDLKALIIFSGLDAGCHGETLSLLGTVNITTSDCLSGNAAGCTVQDTLSTFPLGTCVVDTKGKCKIKTTAETVLGFDVIDGGNTGLELVNCGVARTSSVNSPAPPAGTLSFTCGLLTP